MITFKQFLKERYEEVPISSIKRTEGSHRNYKNTSKVKGIVSDIKSGKGIRNSLEVSRVKDHPDSYRKLFPTNKEYYLHNGHHRLTAAEISKLKTVRVKIRNI